MGTNKYLYSTSRTRAMENNLLDRNKVERMIDAKTPEEVLHILSETDYSEWIGQVKDYTEYETVLKQEQARTYALMKELSPDPALIDIFALKYDIHNLKVLFKAHYLNESRDELLQEGGTVPIKQLKAAIDEQDYSGLEEDFEQIVKHIFEVNTPVVSPKVIDEELDKFYYTQMLKLSKAFKSGILTDYIKTQIDLINIRSFARIKGIHLDREDFKKAYIDGGKYPLNFYMDYFDEVIEAFIAAFEFTEYRDIVKEGLERFNAVGKLTRYEKLADDFAFDVIKKSKYVAFGPEPLVGYLLAKENEMKIIRMLMVGKINNIPNDVIRERLRDVYV